MSEQIVLKGCRENNLKEISLEIPKRKLTVFTGVSGSGKSSLVFDTIAQEAGRQLNETFSFMARLFLPRYRQPDADSIENLSAAAVIDQQRLGANPRSTLGTVTDINTLLRFFFSRFGQPHIGYGHAFSFNAPEGMCPNCEGIGKIAVLDVDRAIDKEKSLNEGAILLPGFGVGSVQWSLYAGSGFFDLDKKLRDYSPEELEKLLHAPPQKRQALYLDNEISVTYEGLAERYRRLNTRADKEETEKSKARSERFSSIAICPQCQGKRYNEKVLSVTIKGHTLFDLTAMQVDELLCFLRAFDDPTARAIIDALTERLQILIDIGLDYLSLTRETPSLSGGEAQRVKLVRHLTSSLNDMLYIFDEPSIGLHPRDVHRLNELLLRLRDKGNTVLVVEHDPDVIRIADYVVDMGPKAGRHGGEIVYRGSYEGLLRADTLTAQQLQRQVDIKRQPRQGQGTYTSRASSLHNLKNVALQIPHGIFTAITGVAGSGKSTLVHQVFAVEHPEAIRIDQSPVATNSRSNPATYTGIMDAIRTCFADANRVSASLFSYNSEGACPHCKGSGSIEINLSFMDKRDLPCPECQGRRYRRDVLDYLYKGKNIVDIMAMTIDEASLFFEQREMARRLDNLVAVGLGYMSLGQPLSTLSGGECQRLKLARELNKKGNLYILDEPTTGLHRSDIRNIIAIIDRLVDAGNTVVVIEHNLDVVKQADWIIDLGPEGGSRGGEIVFQGTPEALLADPHSITGQYLRRSLAESNA